MYLLFGKNTQQYAAYIKDAVDVFNCHNCFFSFFTGSMAHFRLNPLVNSISNGNKQGILAVQSDPLLEFSNLKFHQYSSAVHNDSSRLTSRDTDYHG